MLRVRVPLATPPSFGYQAHAFAGQFVDLGRVDVLEVHAVQRQQFVQRAGQGSDVFLQALV